jgi:RNA polymerase sigma-70 factor (ECF subfamily)
MQGASLLYLLQQHRGQLANTASDGKLLQDFLDHPATETFSVLIGRHGTMVYHVCRRVLQRQQDVEDAFQATFLVLVQKASTLVHRQTVGDWLHGVAYHTALKARTQMSQRMAKERKVARPIETCESEEPEWKRVLDEEIRRLPANFRHVIVHCELEQKTRKEVSLLLGWREGTVASRLSRGRELLCKRLQARGVEIGALVLSLQLAQAMQAAVIPISMAQGVTTAAVQLAKGTALATLVSSKVAMLVKTGTSTGMAMKWGSVAAAGALFTGGVIGMMPGEVPEQQAQNMPQVQSLETKQPPKRAKNQEQGQTPMRMASPVNGGEVYVPMASKITPQANSGTEEEIIMQLGLEDHQLLQFFDLRAELDKQTALMHQLPSGRKERGLELNRDWNVGLMMLFTPEQYYQYCKYWEARQ